jgi:hypothetical protein
MGETKEGVINSTSKLINKSKGIRLHVNEGKTKYMAVSKRPPNIDSIEVVNFKYLGVNFNNKNDMHIEINERITSENICYFNIIKLLKLSCYLENQRYYYIIPTTYEIIRL